MADKESDTLQYTSAEEIHSDLQEIRRKIQEITAKRRAFLSSYLNKIFTSNLEEEKNETQSIHRRH